MKKIKRYFFKKLLKDADFNNLIAEIIHKVLLDAEIINEALEDLEKLFIYRAK